MSSDVGSVSVPDPKISAIQDGLSLPSNASVGLLMLKAVFDKTCVTTQKNMQSHVFLILKKNV